MKLEQQHLAFMDDKMYLPTQYLYHIAKQPSYQGEGNHSVAQLEAICEEFKEYVHQQQIIKQNTMKHILELKFGVVFDNDNKTM